MASPPIHVPPAERPRLLAGLLAKKKDEWCWGVIVVPDDVVGSKVGDALTRVWPSDAVVVDPEANRNCPRVAVVSLDALARGSATDCLLPPTDCTKVVVAYCSLDRRAPLPIPIWTTATQHGLHCRELLHLGLSSFRDEADRAVALAYDAGWGEKFGLSGGRTRFGVTGFRSERIEWTVEAVNLMGVEQMQDEIVRAAVDRASRPHREREDRERALAAIELERQERRRAEREQAARRREENLEKRLSVEDQAGAPSPPRPRVGASDAELERYLRGVLKHGFDGLYEHARTQVPSGSRGEILERMLMDLVKDTRFRGSFHEIDELLRRRFGGGSPRKPPETPTIDHGTDHGTRQKRSWMSRVNPFRRD